MPFTPVSNRRVAIWKLADDAEAYGEDAGKFILTTPGGEREVEPGQVFETADDADLYALGRGWRVARVRDLYREGE